MGTTQNGKLAQIAPTARAVNLIDASTTVGPLRNSSSGGSCSTGIVIVAVAAVVVVLASMLGCWGLLNDGGATAATSTEPDQSLEFAPPAGAGKSAQALHHARMLAISQQQQQAGVQFSESLMQPSLDHAQPAANATGYGYPPAQQPPHMAAF